MINGLPFVIHACEIFYGFECAVVSCEGINLKGACIRLPNDHFFRFSDATLALPGFRLATEGKLKGIEKGWWMCFECPSDMTDKEILQICRRVAKRAKHPYWYWFVRGCRRLLRKFI